jgi:hypothetical protein
VNESSAMTILPLRPEACQSPAGDHPGQDRRNGEPQAPASSCVFARFTPGLQFELPVRQKVHQPSARCNLKSPWPHSPPHRAVAPLAACADADAAERLRGQARHDLRAVSLLFVPIKNPRLRPAHGGLKEAVGWILSPATAGCAICSSKVKVRFAWPRIRG